MSCPSDQASAASPFFAELLLPFAEGRGLMPFSDSARLARAGMGAGALLEADRGEGWPFACTHLPFAVCQQCYSLQHTNAASQQHCWNTAVRKTKHHAYGRCVVL